jgi:hypothetical protein
MAGGSKLRRLAGTTPPRHVALQLPRISTKQLKVFGEIT